MKLLSTTLLALFSQICVAAASEAPSLSPEAALQKLRQGNQRYAAGKSRHPHQGLARRAEVATAQLG